VDVVHCQQTGRPGRPAVVIDQQWLQDALSVGRHIPLTVLAKAIGVHCNTLYKQKQQLGLHRQYSDITDSTLDELLKAYKKLKPNSGILYTVSHSNYLWHIDGHHKLIRWGLVLHGGLMALTDWYMVMLRANTDNRSSTVFRTFIPAVEEYGVPSRVRGDRGGENIDVAIFMIKYRGPNRASFMWGSSTRNTRIERMW
ncbi:hypothetical protein LXA43DRAFT_871716, partial [Ganoderma leucocontextum]